MPTFVVNTNVAFLRLEGQIRWRSDGWNPWLLRWSLEGGWGRVASSIVGSSPARHGKQQRGRAPAHATSHHLSLRATRPPHAPIARMPRAPRSSGRALRCPARCPRRRWRRHGHSEAGRAGGLVARVPAAEPAVVVGGGPRRGRAGRPACRPRLTGHASRIPPGGAAGTRGVPAAAAPVGLFREQGTSGHAAAGGTGTHPAAPPRR